jgi:putative oxidoreductase
MNGTLARNTEWTFAPMRFVAGLLFACHGAQKLFGAFGGQVMTASTLIMTAGIIEFVGGLLIAIGLLTRVAAFIASGEMAVAYFKSHAPQGPWPIQNKGEAAVFYCFVFLFIAAHGAGRYSLDAVLRRSQVKSRGSGVESPGPGA